MISKQAPDFKAQDEQGVWRTLHEFRGKNVVLYFYPKDFTPGCTQQACNLRDNSEQLAEHDIIILGINYDSPESHKKFKAEYHLPFILLSDPDGSIAQRYGATSRLKGYFIPNRITFLIDKNGIIVNVMHNVDPAQQAEDVLKFFK